MDEPLRSFTKLYNDNIERAKADNELAAEIKKDLLGKLPEIIDFFGEKISD